MTEKVLGGRALPGPSGGACSALQTSFLDLEGKDSRVRRRREEGKEVGKRKEWKGAENDRKGKQKEKVGKHTY